MAKKEFTKIIAAETGLSQQQVGRIIQRVLDSIEETLATDGIVELRKFGVFKLKTRASRKVRNPKTGEELTAPEKTVIVFKPGSSMIAKVDEFEAWRSAGSSSFRPAKPFVESSESVQPSGRADHEGPAGKINY